MCQEEMGGEVRYKQPEDRLVGACGKHHMCALYIIDIEIIFYRIK